MGIDLRTQFLPMGICSQLLLGKSGRTRDIKIGQRLSSVFSAPRTKAKACSRAEGTSSASFPYHLLLSPQSNPGTGLRRHKLVPGGISK